MGPPFSNQGQTAQARLLVEVVLVDGLSCYFIFIEVWQFEMISLPVFICWKTQTHLPLLLEVCHLLTGLPHNSLPHLLTKSY